MENFKIVKIEKGKQKSVDQPVTEEVPLTIEVNNNEFATLLCSPYDLENLVIGFLHTSGFLEDISSVKNMVIDQEQWKAIVDMESDGLPEDFIFKRIYTSGCGKGIIFHNPIDIMNQEEIKNDLVVKSENIIKLMKSFLTYSNEYRQTRGVHSSALADDDKILLFRDDIGRHNCMDKIIGEALSTGTQLGDKMILTSGRVSSEIISKMLRTDCPIIVTSGAPTNQAVKTALSLNITLIGRARGRTMNVYSGEQRIK